MAGNAILEKIEEIGKLLGEQAEAQAHLSRVSSKLGFAVGSLREMFRRSVAVTSPEGLPIAAGMRLELDDGPKLMSDDRFECAAKLPHINVIHVLWEGRTLCGEHEGLVPRDWSLDERWISAGESLGASAAGSPVPIPPSLICPSCRVVHEAGEVRDGKFIPARPL